MTIAPLFQMLTLISFLWLAPFAMGSGLLHNSHGGREINKQEHSLLTEMIEEEKQQESDVVYTRNKYGYRLLSEHLPPPPPPPPPPRDLQQSISDPYYTGCDADWKSKQRAYRRNRKEVWTNPTCYSFVLSPICYCVPDDRRPLRIKVKNDIVTSVFYVDDPTDKVPDTVPRPTMNQLFKQLKSSCFTGCPNDGAQECSASYNRVHGNLQRLYINPSLLWADDEMEYIISNFKLC